MNELMKVFFDGLAILKEWGIIKLLRGYIWGGLYEKAVGDTER